MTGISDFTVGVPKIDWNGHCADMRSRLVTWEWWWKLPHRRKRIVIDFTKVSFMDPWAITMFAAYGLEMQRRGIKVVPLFAPDNPANLYQQSMGLGDVITTGSTSHAVAKWQESDQNTGLHVIRVGDDTRDSYDDLRRFKDSAARLALQHCPNASDVLEYAMDEIGRNVIQHSSSPIGGVAIAQHFPDSGRLQVAVCDLGQGILKHLRARNPELQTNMEALRLAILPHASGAAPTGPYGGEQNSGLGLFCSSELAHSSNGSLWIVSGDALLGVRGDVTAARPMHPAKVYRRVVNWPGTVVAMDFPTAEAQSLPDVLKRCSEIAASARKLAGPAGLDFLDDDAEMEAVHTIRVRAFEGDSDQAVRVRNQEIMPRTERGEPVLIDFDGVRVPGQSFVHALLAEALAVPGSLAQLPQLRIPVAVFRGSIVRQPRNGAEASHESACSDNQPR